MPVDARLAHLLKYSLHYEMLYPASTHIIVQQSFLGLLLPQRMRVR